MNQRDEKDKAVITKLGFSVIQQYASSCGVYKVMPDKKEQPLIAKIGWYSEPLGVCPHWFYDHVACENHALERIGGRQGIPQKEAYHILDLKDDIAVVLIRQYLDGRTMSFSRNRNKQDEQALTSLVEGLHADGAASFDIRLPNILFTKQKEPYLFDFGFTKFKDEIPAEQFERYKENDLVRVHWLFTNE